MSIIDLIAHIGTIFLLVGSHIKDRATLHKFRIIGCVFWTYYGFAIWNIPIIVVDSIALVNEVWCLIKFRK